MNERQMWAKMRTPLNEAGHAVSVESHMTTIGIPDVHYCIEGVSGWIELKQTTTTKAPTVRPAQVQWITKEIAAGGTVFVYAYFEALSDDGKDAWLLIPGKHIKELAQSARASDWWDLATLVHFDKPKWTEVIAKLFYC